MLMDHYPNETDRREIKAMTWGIVIAGLMLLGTLVLAALEFGHWY